MAAILRAKRIEGESALLILAESIGDFESSIRQALEHFKTGIEQYDVGDLLSLGFSEGINHETVGPSFVEDGLEPIIQSAMQRLAVHQARGEMRVDVDLRVSAIALVSPLIVAYLHQESLSGKASHPMDLEALTAQVCDTFVRAYRAES